MINEFLLDIDILSSEIKKYSERNLIYPNFNFKENNYTNIKNIFKELESLFHNYILNNSIEIRYNMIKDNFNILIDPHYLEIILFHVFTNSLECAKKNGKILCKVKATTYNISILIIDNGFQYDQFIIQNLREVRGDSDLFFSYTLINKIIKILEVSIQIKYTNNRNITKIILPTGKKNIDNIIKFPN